jgi:dihydroorotase-like cyclic amidohydrolase
VKVDCVIQNARLVDDKTERHGWLAMDNGKIVALSEEDAPPDAKRVIDAENRVLMPGVFDPHCHLGVHYPYYLPFYKERRAVGEQNAILDFGFHFGIQREEHIHEIPDIARETGVQSFKLYFGYEPDNPIGIVPANDGWVYATMRQAVKLPRGVVSVHCENTSIARWIKQEIMETGRTDLAAFSESRPVLCEVETIRRMIFLAKKTGCPLQVVHTTAGEGPDLAAAAREDGVDVRIETCPHYLLRTAYDDDLDVKAKISPPLRDEEQKEWLWRGIFNGRVYSLGSDHVPFFPKKGENVWTEKPGVVTFPWELALLLDEGVNKRGLSLSRLVELNSTAPAKRFGIYPEKGSLEIGTDADLVLADLDLEKEAGPPDKGTSIYTGMKLKGWPVMTISRGQVICENGQVNEDLYGRGRCLITPEMT